MARRKVEINLNGLEKKKKPKFTYDPDNDPFILRNAKERMDAAKDMEIPNMLMGELIYERTIIMLFFRDRTWEITSCISVWRRSK